jgi:hypothetical protein
MNAAVLYGQLFRIATGADLDPNFSFDPDKIAGSIRVHVGRNSGVNISHITIEFADEYRAKLLVCILFDGSGDMGTGLNGVAMPKVKLPKELKAMVALACLTYLCTVGILRAHPQYFREKIEAELYREAAAQRRSVLESGAGSKGHLLRDFDQLTNEVVEYVAFMSKV